MQHLTVFPNACTPEYIGVWGVYPIYDYLFFYHFIMNIVVGLGYVMYDVHLYSILYTVQCTIKLFLVYLLLEHFLSTHKHFVYTQLHKPHFMSICAYICIFYYGFANVLGIKRIFQLIIFLFNYLCI